MKQHKRFFALAAFFLIGIGGPLFAAEKTIVGTACSAAASRVDWDTIFQCVSGVWKVAPHQLGTSSDACSSSTSGLLQWTGTSFQGCDGSTWKTLGGGGASDNLYGLVNLTSAMYGKTYTTSMGYNGKTALAISVTGDGNPYISISGSAYAKSGTISPGQTLTIRAVAPYANLATNSITLTTGTQVDTWKITTASATYIYAAITDLGAIACPVGTSCSNSEHHGSFANEYNCNGSGQNVYIQTYAGTNTYAYQFRNDCNEWYGSYSGDTNATSWTGGWNIGVWMGVTP